MTSRAVGCIAAACLASCKPPEDSTFRTTLREEAHLTWIDLQMCLGGVEQLPVGDAFVAHLERLARGRILEDDWPSRCVPYLARLRTQLFDADLTAASEAAVAFEIPAIGHWSASRWDPLVAEMTAAKLPEVLWDAAPRGVPPSPAAPDPRLSLDKLKLQPGPIPRDAPGTPPMIPGEMPREVASLIADTRHPSCTTATSHAVIGGGLLALGTRYGWMTIPFAQPIDEDRPLLCHDDAVEVVYARDGVRHLRCDRAGCRHDFIDLGDRNRLVVDAILSGDQLLAVLRGVGGRVYLVRASEPAQLPAAALVPLIDAPDATLRFWPSAGGAVLELSTGKDVRAVRFSRDGELFDL